MKGAVWQLGIPRACEVPEFGCADIIHPAKFPEAERGQRLKIVASMPVQTGLSEPSIHVTRSRVEFQ